ncbi:MAG: hypothetical protein Q4B52_08060 [Tissierellia bacterium]|nr:hypothetical protein [Tissierellia bacterium]
MKKIKIKDSKIENEKVIYENHPFFEKIRSSMMPNEYRKQMHEISNVGDQFIEDEIKLYYESIEAVENKKTNSMYIFYELEPIEIWEYILPDFDLLDNDY